ncbi:PLD nuclease N-terminal domain-containing protein [Jeotgalibacillus haloalkalitolerans]|uniref:PLD nuclease N-terminal domain-containing protein n=1 Tax=Jeotgalibacillus haloalkalitolerans TaxID=3104292 RepID=A0ABU5KHG0_9BACL|nr:PLD nuclease N-terminal domain-containing protein [Jeotgalibacillus sp. HH7-29]MDZ5710579.1 PLD nuclease N-terminal domain-containing protein [Jeotgalibacillus sp. HH7-29]
MDDLNFAIIAPLAFINIVLAVTALVDLFKRPSVNGPKWVWALVIIFINMIGPILYFVIGRRDT